LWGEWGNRGLVVSRKTLAVQVAQKVKQVVLVVARDRSGVAWGEVKEM